MRYVTSMLVLPLLVLAGGSTAAASSASPHDLALACIAPDALLAVATVDVARPRGTALDPARIPPTAPSRQQQSGETPPMPQNAPVKGLLPYTVAVASAMRADPDDPDDDVWSYTANCRLYQLNSVWRPRPLTGR